MTEPGMVTVRQDDLELILGCVEFGGWAGPNSKSVQAYVRLLGALSEADGSEQ
jgi:hypothetical protein